MAKRPVTVIDISSDEEAPAGQSATESVAETSDKNRASTLSEAPPTYTVGARGLWGGHAGEQCSGSNQLPCCFGPNGQPAAAGHNGRCDLCSGEVIEMLHCQMQQRLTHLIVELTGKPLEHALIRLKMILGAEASEMYRRRRERALHRRRADRPRRGPRK